MNSSSSVEQICDDSLFDRSTAAEHLERGTVIVFDEDPEVRSSVVDGLRCEFPDLKIVAAEAPASAEVRTSTADVRIVNLSGIEPAQVGEMMGRAAHVAEVSVYWAEDLLAPQVRAARALGVCRIVQRAHLLSWLRAALVPLIAEAQGRRLLESARVSMPPLPAWGEEAPPTRLGLTQAETMFRETYVAAVLAETGNCRRAAELARVPYRTFYDIVRKLSLR